MGALLAVAAVVLPEMGAPCHGAQATREVENERVLDSLAGQAALRAWSTRENAALSISHERASRGERSLRFQSPGGAASPSAVRRLSAQRGEADWSGHQLFAFDVFNPSGKAQRLRVRFGGRADRQHTSQYGCEPRQWTTVTVRTADLEALDLSRMRYVRFYPPKPKQSVVLFLDNLRLYDVPAIAIEATRRTSFRRMEQNARVELTVTNRGRVALTGGRLVATFDDGDARVFELGAIAPKERRRVACPVDARLRPGKYQLEARVAFPAPPAPQAKMTIPVHIVPRPLPSRMRTFMLWGDMPLDMLQEVGLNTFTPGGMADTTATWQAGAPTAQPRTEAEIRRFHAILNKALVRGLDVYSRCEAPGRIARWRRMRQYYRVDAEGKPYEDRVRQNVLHPDLQRYAYNFGASLARAYGDFPAFVGAFIHSEERGRSTAPSFDEHSRRAFRDYAGLDVPSQVSAPRASRGLDYRDLKGFPTDRVIEDDYPLYVYYRWFWKAGDGWNLLNTQVHRGLEGMARSDLWTMHAPAMRVASVYGSGGALTHLGQWTYAHPGPLNYAMPTDQLLAMAAGASPPQRVTHTISVFTKRSYVMPADKRDQAFFEEDAWVDKDPHAKGFAMTADQMRGAFWHIISRPVHGVSWFGIKYLLPETGGKSNHNPELIPEMTRLARGILEPLGPALIEIPDRPADVAFLTSLASEMFAQRGTYGYGFRGWAGTAYRMLLHAHLQPEIVFEETIQRKGLAAFRVLVMMHCDVLPRSVADRVLAFQRRGGVVVADEFLTPAIQPNVLIRSDSRDPAAAETPAELEKAAELRERLARHYSRYVECTAPEVIVRTRAYGTADYIFVVNDRRRAGNYLGQHGVVREYGVPSRAEVALARPNGGHVYNLVAGRAVPATVVNRRLRVDVALGPCEGRLLMATDRAIAGVRLTAPAEIRRDVPAELCIAVVDAQGEPIRAVVPMRVDITDPRGRPAEPSGFYAAKGGLLRVRLEPAQNDEAGKWTVAVRELASGREARCLVRLIR